MQKGVYHKKVAVWLLSNYITFPLIGYYSSGVYFVLFGLILAILIEGFSPTWGYELSWKDIRLAMQNHYDFGCNGAHLTFIIGKRKLHIYRDDKGHPIRIGIRIPLKAWEDIFNATALDAIFEKYGGMTILSKWHFKDTIVYFPDEELEDCISILKLFINKAEGGLNHRIAARSNCSKKAIWEKHE